jgi:hypothetical protein
MPERAMNSLVLIIIAAISFGTGVMVTHWKHNSDALSEERMQTQVDKAARAAAASVADQTAEAIGGIRIESRTIYQQGRTEVVRVPVYADCLVPAAGSQLLNEARGFGDGRPVTDPALPANATHSDPERRADPDG